ncbi:MAG TPA: HIT domain-containing protein [Candidatus Eremiobacteraceae bacterium]|nr:HIT domain-containing protein [Candidatus Eremiobacteraceae bacterium]
MTDPCVFCDIVAGKFNTTFLYEDDEVVAFADLHAVAPRHVLVVPREHFADLPALAATDAASGLLGKLMQVAAKMGASAVEGGGYRVVVNSGRQAGQTVFHLHLHVMAGRHFAWPPG